MTLEFFTYYNYYGTLVFWQHILQHAVSICLQSVVLLKLSLKIIYAHPLVTNMLIIKNIKSNLTHQLLQSIYHPVRLMDF